MLTWQDVSSWKPVLNYREHMQGPPQGCKVSLQSFLIVSLIVVAISQTGCKKKEVRAETPTPDVQVAPVIQQDVPLYTECISTLDGYVNAQIQPQVTGYLLKQNYSEGKVVGKGEVLFEIDPRPFEAAVAQSQGQLGETEAQLSKTKLDVARDTPLAKQSAIPQAQLDNDIQANAAAEAQVTAAKAQLEQTRLNLVVQQLIST